MSDMSNNEVLKFEPPQENKTVYSSEVVDDGSSALKLEPDASEEKDRDAQIGEIEREIVNTEKLMVVDPVDEKVILEPIKDIYNRPNFAEKTVKFIRRAGLKIGTTFLALTTLGSAAACGPIEAAASTPEPATITATQPPEVHVGDATVKTSNNESLPTPSPTEAPTPTATPETTSTPKETSPTPVAKTTETPLILKGKDKERVEVNQRFEDFLNGKGDYTDKKLKESYFLQSYSDNKDLGCVDAHGNTFVIQGVLLHYGRTDEGEVFAFGTKNKDGKRTITLVEFPSRILFKNIGMVRFWNYSDSSLSSNPDPKTFVLPNSDYYDFLKSNEGKVLTVDVKTRPIAESSGYESIDDGLKKALTEALDPKVEVNSNFVTSIGFVDDKDHQLINSSEYIKGFFDAEEGSIITVNNFDEFDEFLQTGDFSKIPSTLGIGFRSN